METPGWRSHSASPPSPGGEWSSRCYKALRNTVLPSHDADALRVEMVDEATRNRVALTLRILVAERNHTCEAEAANVCRADG
jgi:hypothetical protein